MGKLINRIPGSRLLISSLPTSVLKALPGKLDIKRHSPSILYFLFMWFILDTLLFPFLDLF